MEKCRVRDIDNKGFIDRVTPSPPGSLQIDNRHPDSDIFVQIKTLTALTAGSMCSNNICRTYRSYLHNCYLFYNVSRKMKK